YSGGGPMMSDGNGTAFWEGYGGASVPTITFSVRMLGVHLPVVIVTQTVIQVVPCNFYQQQCWWEPLIFYGMYVGLWVGVGASMSVRARSMTYLFGASVSYATLYLVLLGELPYPFAILAFLGAVVYGLRLDGVL